MQNRIKINKRKLSFFVGLFAGFCFLFVCFIVFSTGVLSGINKDIDNERDKLISIEIEKNTFEGSITDRWGMAITSAGAAGESAAATDEECFSHIIGFNSPIYGKSGLRSKYYSYLFNGGKDDCGATIKLTLDSELQKKCYDMLYGYVGSITVMNAKTGELLALASRSDAKIGYNVNIIDSFNDDGLRYFDVYNGIDAFWFNRATMAQDPPGSTFKIVTAASMIENGIADYEYNDTGSISVSGAEIFNYGKYAYGYCDLEQALNKSINTYFASAGTKLGARAIGDTAAKYLIGSKIELDFTQLDSNIDFSGLNNNFIIASTAYGQGKLVISPLQLCMISQAVINDGKMIRPHMIADIVDDGRSVYKFPKETLLSETIGTENNAILKEFLHSNGEYYGFDEDTYGYVIAKTGTAEVSYGAGNHIYLTLAVEFGDSAYAICIDHTDVAGITGQSLTDDAKVILDFLKTLDSIINNTGN